MRPVPGRIASAGVAAYTAPPVRRAAASCPAQARWALAGHHAGRHAWPPDIVHVLVGSPCNCSATPSAPRLSPSRILRFETLRTLAVDTPPPPPCPPCPPPPPPPPPNSRRICRPRETLQHFFALEDAERLRPQPTYQPYLHPYEPPHLPPPPLLRRALTSGSTSPPRRASSRDQTTARPSAAGPRPAVTPDPCPYPPTNTRHAHPRQRAPPHPPNGQCLSSRGSEPVVRPPPLGRPPLVEPRQRTAWLSIAPTLSPRMGRMTPPNTPNSLSSPPVTTNPIEIGHRAKRRRLDKSRPPLVVPQYSQPYSSPPDSNPRTATGPTL